MKDGCPRFAEAYLGRKRIFECFLLLSSNFLVRLARAIVGLPPDFLWSLVALAHLMRLSLLKAAHAAVGECHAAGNPDRPPFSAGTLWRTWGTRPVPIWFWQDTNLLRKGFSHGAAHTGKWSLTQNQQAKRRCVLLHFSTFENARGEFFQPGKGAKVLVQRTNQQGVFMQ
jgi:hypothetical protein